MIKSDFSSIVKKLYSANESLENHPFDEAIESLENKIQSSKYKISVVGDFSTGKSTFINALLGEEILYTSTKEATGIITTVQYEDRAHAEICEKTEGELADKIIEDIDLSTSEGLEKLNKYLDIETKTQADQVKIYYPMSGIDKDIIFLDTPGIEKLSMEQMIMTKKSIAESNAIIFMITKKGFTEQAIKVIAGEHEVIGKIPTKDIIVVVTHIGEVYEDKNDSDVNSQIEKIVNEAKKQLLNKGINDIDVFPLDSKDYLWGTNEQSYKKEQKQRNVVLNGEMLSPEEYRKRSHFDEFKNKLYSFLDRDNLQKNKYEDIRNNILLVSEAIENKMLDEDEKGRSNNAILISQLEEKIEISCDNQRKLYNSLIRKLENHMDNFLEDVEKDSKQQEKHNINVLSLIQYLFQKVDDINESNVQQCIDKTFSEVEDFAREIEYETQKHINSTCNNFVKDTFSEQFQSIFDKSVNIENLSIKQYKTDLVLKRDDYNSKEIINDDNLEQLKKERENITVEISDLKEKINNIVKKNEKQKKDNQKKRKEIENWYESEIIRLGDRPKAVQKYRQVKKTKGILFWKQTWYEDIPDGMDNSAGLRWDDKQNEIHIEYDNKIDELEKEENKVFSSNTIISHLDNQLQEYEARLKHIEDNIILCQQALESEKKEYAESYISNKKEAIASYCDTIRRDLLKQVTDSVSAIVNENKKEIRASIKGELEIQMRKYREELQEKNKILTEQTKVTQETIKEMLSSVREIKEEMQSGQAI
jgi:GTPase Era involved in 16S rRNA processing